MDNSKLIKLWEIKIIELERKIKELNNRQLNKQQDIAFKNLSNDLEQTRTKINLFKSFPETDCSISVSYISREGIKYLDNPNISIGNKLIYIEKRKESLKKIQKNSKCIIGYILLFKLNKILFLLRFHSVPLVASLPRLFIAV